MLILFSEWFPFVDQGEITNSYYNGSSCICPNLTRYANQACGAFFLSIETISSLTQEINSFRLVGDALYGQTCGAAISCVSNYICSPTAVVCTCDTTTQFYNGSYCVQRYNYNDSCTQTLHCMTSSNLYCLS